MRFSEGEMTAGKAGELTAKGYMCSQCVFARFAQELGMDEELALRLTASFGGGSFFGGTCGAVIGAHLALAMKHGWSEDPAREQIMKLVNVCAPDHAVSFLHVFHIAFGNREVQGNERREGPVKKSCGKAVVLAEDHLFPHGILN